MHAHVDGEHKAQQQLIGKHNQGLHYMEAVAGVGIGHGVPAWGEGGPGEGGGACSDEYVRLRPREKGGACRASNCFRG